MKKVLSFILALAMVFTLVGCTSGGDTTPAGPKDGTYSTFFPQPTYLAKATVTVENGEVTDTAYEEIHLPSYWATFSADEAAGLTEDAYFPVEGARGTTYYARNVMVGAGDEAIPLRLMSEEAKTYGGSDALVYGNDDIPDFAEYVQTEENADWYYSQIEEGNYWVCDGDGVKLEDASVYSFTRKDGLTLDKAESRMKTHIRHWTAKGTGFGTESGELGWTGNLDIIAKFMVDNGFPEGEAVKGDDGFWKVGDLSAGATIEQFPGYVQMFRDAYAKALA